MEDDCESFEHLWKLFCMKTLNGTHKYKPLSKKKKKKDRLLFCSEIKENKEILNTSSVDNDFGFALSPPLGSKFPDTK